LLGVGVYGDLGVYRWHGEKPLVGWRRGGVIVNVVGKKVIVVRGGQEGWGICLVVYQYYIIFSYLIVDPMRATCYVHEKSLKGDHF